MVNKAQLKSTSRTQLTPHELEMRLFAFIDSKLVPEFDKDSGGAQGRDVNYKGYKTKNNTTVAVFSPCATYASDSTTQKVGEAFAGFMTQFNTSGTKESTCKKVYIPFAEYTGLPFIKQRCFRHWILLEVDMNNPAKPKVTVYDPKPYLPFPIRSFRSFLGHAVNRKYTLRQAPYNTVDCGRHVINIIQAKLGLEETPIPDIDGFIKPKVEPPSAKVDSPMLNNSSGERPNVVEQQKDDAQEAVGARAAKKIELANPFAGVNKTRKVASYVLLCSVLAPIAPIIVSAKIAGSSLRSIKKYGFHGKNAKSKKPEVLEVEDPSGNPGLG